MPVAPGSAVCAGGVEAFDIVKGKTFDLLMGFGAVLLFDEFPERLIRRARLMPLFNDSFPLRPEIRFPEPAVNRLPAAISELNGSQSLDQTFVT